MTDFVVRIRRTTRRLRNEAWLLFAVFDSKWVGYEGTPIRDNEAWQRFSVACEERDLREWMGVDPITGTPKWTVRALNEVWLFCALTSLLAAVVFLLTLVLRGVYWVAGWRYPFESIADFLGVHPHSTAQPIRWLLVQPFKWDRTFLLAVTAGLLFGVALLIWDSMYELVGWAAMTPDERHQKREQKREQQRRAVEDRRAAAVAEKTAKEDARRDRHPRKPMSGWRRLWIVLSVMFGALAAIVAWQPTRHDYVTVSRNVTTNDQFWSTSQAQEELSRCVYSTARSHFEWGDESTYTYSVDCDNKDPLTPAILWALFPAILMASVGLTVRWIYRGFKPLRTNNSTQPVIPDANSAL